MIYHAGERIDFLPLTTQHPDTAVFQLTDGNGQLAALPLTQANGGLVARRKGALHPIFTAPTQPGRYSWRYWDTDQVLSGQIRITPATPATPAGQPDQAQLPIPQQAAPRPRPGMGLIE